MKYVMSGGVRPGMSLYSIAETIAKTMEGEVAVTRGDLQRLGLRHQDTVISLDPNEVEKVLELRRYIGKFRYVLYWTSNTEEYDDPSIVEILLRVQKEELVVPSQHSRDRLISVAKKWLSPSISRQLVDRCKVLPIGIDPRFVPGEGADPLNWVVPFNRIDTRQKGVELNAHVTELASVALAQRGKQVRASLYLPVGGGWTYSAKEVRLDKAPEVYSVVEQPHSFEQYLANAQKHGMFLCTSEYESYGMYYLELLAAGVVGVFARKPWIEKLLPGYPLMFPPKAEDLASACVEVCENWEHYRETVGRYWSSWIQDTYGLARFKGNVVEMLG